MNKKIAGILCDLDDTLLETWPLFDEQINMYCDFCSNALGVEQNTFRKSLQTFNDSTFVKYGVRRSKWQIVIAQLATLYGGSSESILTKYYYLLDEIYRTAPKLKPGVEEFLERVNEKHLKLSIITHANIPWTIIKMDKYGLWSKIDSLRIVSETGHKTEKEWLEECVRMRVMPFETLGIGDSILSDIIPMFKAGIAHRVWIDNANAWKMYVDHELPKGTVTVKSIADVIPLFLED